MAVRGSSDLKTPRSHAIKPLIDVCHSDLGSDTFKWPSRSCCSSGHPQYGSHDRPWSDGKSHEPSGGNESRPKLTI